MSESVRKIVFRDIIIYFILALVVCILSVGAISIYSYFNFKTLTNHESRTAITTSFAYEKQNLQYVNSLHSVWTQAYENIVLKYNDQWVRDNIGNDVGKVFGIDLVVIMDDKGTMDFISNRGNSVGEDVQRKAQMVLFDFMQSKRTTRFNVGVIADVAELHDRPYLITIAEIQPSYDASVRVESGKQPKFLILAQNLDATVVRNLKKFTQINSLNFVYSLEKENLKDMNSFNIENDIKTIGYFVWEPSDSAKAILSQIVPVSSVTFLILVVLTALIAMNVLRAAVSYDQLITNLRAASLDLKSARDIAERSSENKSTFLATMSHELRTPMNGIIGMLSLLRDTDMDKEQTGYVNTIESSSSSLMKLIDDILEFSQSEIKEQETHIEPTDLRALVTEIQGLLQPVAVQKRLRFDIFFSQSVPKYIDTDPVRFRQVLLHLTSNAFKFTDEGHVRINVNIAPLDDDYDELIVQVIDTGVGMNSSVRENLFKEGFSKEAIDSNVSGQSLGLGIASNLVKLLGGKMNCESNPGQGSVFWFSLPLSKDKTQ